MPIVLSNVRFSNRPFGVKRFQTIRTLGVDVARGLVLLFGIGTKALPSLDSKTRWNNLWGGLAVLQTVGPSGHPRCWSRSSAGHQAPAHLIVSHDGQQTAMQDAELLAQYSPYQEQRFDQDGEIRQVLDKLLDT